MTKLNNKPKLTLSKTMPLDVGVIHLIGIGGIGMSGIAEILHNLGYTVQGSDIAESANVLRLKQMGIKVYVGHRKGNVSDAAVVVKSSAVKYDNPEVVAARERQIPVLRRAEMLAEITRLKTCIAIAGTHGKTTTTAMCGAILSEAGLDPTIINGGIINSYGTNAFLGSGDWMVVEADESDGTFIKIPAAIGVITNIDPEHLDYYGSYKKLKDAFKIFIENLPFYGFAVLCNDHPVVRKLGKSVADRKIFTYGVSSKADVVAKNIRNTVEGSEYDVAVSVRVTGDKKLLLKNVRLALPGIHNVQNSLSIIAIAVALGLPESVIIRALKKFGGVKRRFTKTGEVNNITVIDDYAHHPTEIKATLKAAREVINGKGKGRVIAVFQPHRYSRVQDLFDDFCNCFGDADEIIVSDIHPAGEKPIKGIDKVTIINGIKKSTKKQAISLKSEKDLASVIWKVAKSGDLVVCMGAGSITNWANTLPSQLAHMAAKN